MAIVFKILSQVEWERACEQGRFDGADVDLRDGFIHFSTADQVMETAAKHFLGCGGLLLLAVNADALGSQLRWEPSRGGFDFPHLYRSLAVNEVLWAEPLGLGPDGKHVFPKRFWETHTEPSSDH